LDFVIHDRLLFSVVVFPRCEGFFTLALRSPTWKKEEEAKSLGPTQANAAERVTEVKWMARSLRRDESGSLLERPPAMLKNRGDAERISTMRRKKNSGHFALQPTSFFRNARCNSEFSLI